MIDSSVLLDLYRVTPTARSEMIESLISIEGNLWVPHQVALEFHRNRLEAARDQLSFYDETCKSLETAQNQALQRLNEFANRSALDNSEKRRLKEPLEKAFGVAIERVKSHQGVFDLTISRVLNDDPVLKTLAKLFDGKVGQPFSEAEYAKAQAEAARRRDGRIPPGYKDRAKRTNPDGDYLWWEQTLIRAAEGDKPVLVISNDEKEDWINKRIDFSLGPREELIEEMRQRAGVSLRIINFATFLEAVRADSPVAVSRETVSQANIARRQGEKRAKRIYVSPAIIEKYEAHLLRVIERRDAELKENAVERARNAGNSDMMEVLDARASGIQYAINMYQDHLRELSGVIENAPRLKGDLALQIDNDSLRRALIERVHEERRRLPDTS
ncbi:PIN-like domain-containing protein [Streptomyces sp. NBC_01558]|uniref:PIN-like domain-containing protein n=1 Tax=Streptomyces sp. NBC_01558 TaxID=2975878 RepID=UPI002DDA0D78|nr:PIN-like domain-containing protein [Streptomyces sp. NBC_01558]WSD78803.1 PIN-like domain-containing protein [Streptomyces sp. NBC_01558]